MSAGNNLNSYFHANSKDTMPLGGIVVVAHRSKLLYARLQDGRPFEEYDSRINKNTWFGLSHDLCL